MSEFQAAGLLWRAWRSGQPIDGLPAELRPADAAHGMAIQAALEEIAGPGFGWKLAATSTASQAFLGVDGPIAGRMFERFRHVSGDTIPADTTNMGVVEAEFAFRMARDVGPEQSTLDTVLAAVDTMLLAIEIPNSRFVEFTKAGQPQICADAGYSARFVQGKEISDWAELDLPAQPVTLFINNTEIARGNGAAVLGDPRIALRWIANELPKYGRQLRAGDIISTGTATKAPPIKAGDYVRADFGELGIVETTFAG